ncbi:MAG: formylglycine-generating enzyme family protein [Cyanophyceae cyanobacterium]
MTVSQGEVKYRVNLRYQNRSGRYYAEDLGNGILLKMVEIPGGSFQMSSPATEIGHESSEEPQHEVSLSDFCLGMHPVTQAQWRTVASFPQVKRKLEPDPSEFKGDNRPVEQVSWYQAVEFCDRLSRHTEREYRLPTEAEWEYACRAGTTTPFHFGETITTDLANYRGTDLKTDSETYLGNYGRGPRGIDREETTEAGYFKVANRFGLYDMHGNVWEWCLDHWHDSYEEKPEELKKNGNKPWSSDDESANSPLRGGAWYEAPKYCRSAFRYSGSPNNRYNDFGFRVLCSSV